MRTDIRDTLISIARKKTLITYEQLNVALNLGLNFDYPSDRDLIGNWLGEISEFEVLEKRHMLSALVVHKKDKGFGEPGEGFYKYAIELGVYDRRNDEAFWFSEVTWLHNYWSSHPIDPGVNTRIHD